MAKDSNTFEVFLGAGGPDALPLTPLDPHYQLRDADARTVRLRRKTLCINNDGYGT